MNGNSPSFPLVSVIIPVYNVAAFLPRCLNSILNSSYEELEVICVNDGSTDNSAEVLEQFAKKDSRVKVIHKSNGGVTSARNCGLDTATGEWVTFIDSDDWIHHRFFEIMLQAWEKDGKNAEVIFCNMATTSLDIETDSEFSEVPTYRMTWQHIENGFTEKWALFAKLYKRALIGNFRLPDHLRYGEDISFNLLALSRMKSFAGVKADAALYYYYQRPGSAVTKLPALLQLESFNHVADRLTDIPSAEAKCYCSRILVACMESVHVMEMHQPHSLLSQGRKQCRKALGISWKAGFKSLTDFKVFLRQVLYYIFPSLQYYWQIRKHPSFYEHIRQNKQKREQYEKQSSRFQ